MDGTSCDLAEIVEEIMNNLRRLTRPESEVEARIRQDIEALREQILHAEPRYKRSEIKKSAQEIEAAVAEVERLLQQAHPVVKDGLGLLKEPPVDVLPSGEVLPPAWAPKSKFQRELERVRIMCEKLARYPPVAHHNFDRAKLECASYAFKLMRELSHQAPTGTAEGPFRTISSLLYQALSGERLDLKRACDKTLWWERAVEQGDAMPW